MNSTSYRYPRLLTTVLAGLFAGVIGSFPIMVAADSNTPSHKAERHRDKMHLPKVKEAAYPTRPQQEVRKLRQR